MRRGFAGVVLGLGALALAGCAALEAELARRTPQATVEKVRLQSLDFDSAGLAVDLRIDNPNPVGLDLAGLDYALRIADRKLVSGRRDRSLELGADSGTRLTVPVRLGFDALADLPGEVTGRAELPYAVDLGLDFAVPGLGPRRVGVTAEGNLPVPRVPRVRVADLRVDSLGLSGARVALVLAVENPNAFAIALDRLGYSLAVDGRSWASGQAESDARLAAGGESRITLPLTLDLATLGSAAYRMLREGATVDYALQGTLAARADLPVLGAFERGYERTGRVALGR